jgi:uncharacterized protein
MNSAMARPLGFMFLPAVLLLTLLAPLTSCAPAMQQQDVAAAAAPAANLPLWELSGPVGTVYLLGSIHLLRPDVYPLDETLYTAFDQADMVVFELDFGEMAAAAPMMMEVGIYDDGRTLAQDLPADVYAELAAAFDRIGLPEQVYGSMKPWLASMTLSMATLQQAGFDGAAGIDMHFYQRAREAGKEVGALETMEEQLQVFDGMDRDAQVALVRSTLDDLDGAVTQLDLGTDRWRRGDTEGLAELFIDQMGDQPELLERLLHERNRRWIPQIEDLLQRPGTAIVIVGVGHLAGDENVVELLRQRGHEVTQLGTGSLVGATATP